MITDTYFARSGRSCDWRTPRNARWLMGLLVCWFVGSCAPLPTSPSTDPPPSASQPPSPPTNTKKEALPVVRLTPWWTAADYPGEAEIEDLILAGTNRERERMGRPPLQADENLRVAARQHSQEMLEKDYFSHLSPEKAWVEPNQRAYYAGAWEAFVGENISRNFSSIPRTVAEIASHFVSGWIESPDHRKNILKEEFTHLGVGVVERNGWYCGTQLFATRYYDVREATLRAGREMMLRVRCEMATKATSINVWVNQRFNQAVKVGRSGSAVLELTFPRNNGAQEIWLATSKKVQLTVRLDPTRTLREALTSRSYGQGLRVTHLNLQEVEQAHYLLTGRARLLQPVKQVRLFLDDVSQGEVSWDDKGEMTWTLPLPQGSGRHQIGLFPDQWKKYLFFVDTDQPLDRAFVPRFSPY